MKGLDYEEAQRRELARWEGVTVTRERRGKHMALRICVGERSRFITYPVTGSDWRGMKNHIARLRRTLADLQADPHP